MTVACARRLSGAARVALATSACDAPGSRGSVAGAPRPGCCAKAVTETNVTRTNGAMHFMRDLLSDSDPTPAVSCGTEQVHGAQPIALGEPGAEHAAGTG